MIQQEKLLVYTTESLAGTSILTQTKATPSQTCTYLARTLWRMGNTLKNQDF